MPHNRERHILSLIIKRIKSSPVTTIHGARQTGKSFLVRELLKKNFPLLNYKTFDSTSEQRFARSNPETYLRTLQEARPLAIDEAQKVPEIFDAVKLLVDESRESSQFILTGSTEFSHRTRIRESLTGRMTSVRIFPFSLSESMQIKHEPKRWEFGAKLMPRITRKDLLRYLARGGMPGIFSVRDEETREQYIDDWLELTWGRDIHQTSRNGGDSSLCRDILFSLASVDVPDAGIIAKLLKFSTRAVQKQIDILETLFVINRIRPHKLGAGKDRYFICDVGFAKKLGASFERQLQTWLYQEALVSLNLSPKLSNTISYYVTSRGSVIDLVIKHVDKEFAIKLLSSEAIDKRELLVLSAFNNKSKIKPIALGATRGKVNGVEIFPWEIIA